MRILLVNDDGIHSPGIAVLKEGLSGNHEVWVCAPDREKSGSSNSITFSEAVRTALVSDRTLAVSGTPADCVLVAARDFLPAPPDLVISGINIGPNLGADIVYSGTAGAARQAVFLGIPGVALSIDTFAPPYYFDIAVDFVSRNAEDFASLWHNSGDRSHFLNINFPNVERFEGSVVVAPPAKLVHENRMVSFTSPRGETYGFYEGNKRIGISDGAPADIDHLARGNIVVSPVKVYPELSEISRLYAAHTFRTNTRRG
ncbi:MAG: 5'/3'-nucleotidase SurE, partial [Spirochaetales bacterium]|nr:5'/3'-nucleotidase SurE [Spirochaetales bacterium]